MTLFDDGMRSCPGIDAYRNQESIPEAERCESCEGIGLVRIQFSGCMGRRSSKDWRVCWSCNGSGRRRWDENGLENNSGTNNSGSDC